MKCSQSPIDPFAHPLSLMQEVDSVKAIEQNRQHHHQHAESFGDSRSVVHTPFNEPLDSPHTKSMEDPSDRSKKRHISVIDLLPSIHQAATTPEEVIYEVEDEGILGFKVLVELLTSLDATLRYNAFL